jgi:hypothetical protein
MQDGIMTSTGTKWNITNKMHIGTIRKPVEQYLKCEFLISPSYSSTLYSNRDKLFSHEIVSYQANDPHFYSHRSNHIWYQGDALCEEIF